MKFNEWSMNRIRRGTKTITSRKKKHLNDPDIFHVFGPLPWWFIKRFLYRGEGAESPEELQEEIDKIFARRGYPVADNEEFFVHVIDTIAVQMKSG